MRFRQIYRTIGVNYQVNARAVGVSKEQLVDAFAWASIYAGVEAVSLADEVAGDVIRAM